MFCFAVIKEIINLVMLLLLLGAWICRGKEKQQEPNFCSGNTVMARTLIKMTRAVLWLSCICREKRSTGRRMMSLLKPISPSPTDLTWYFMSQLVAGIATPVVFRCCALSRNKLCLSKHYLHKGVFQSDPTSSSSLACDFNMHPAHLTWPTCGQLSGNKTHVNRDLVRLT